MMSHEQQSAAVPMTAFDFALLSITVFAAFVQLFVLWLICTKCAEAMREYRLYLFMQTASDMLFGIVLGIVIQPELWFPYTGGAYVKGLGRFLDTDWSAQFWFGLAAFAISSQMIIQAFSMLFRFATLMKNVHPKLSHWLSHATTRCAIVAVTLSIACAVGTLAGFCFIGKNNAVKWAIMNVRERTLSEPSIVAQFSRENNASIFQSTSNGLQDLKSIVDAIFSANISIESLSVTSSVYFFSAKFTVIAVEQHLPLIVPEWAATKIFVAYAVIIVAFILTQTICLLSGILIMRYLRRNVKSMSRQTYELQMQLVTLLVIQMCSPLVLIILPILYVIFLLVRWAAGNEFQMPSRPGGDAVIISFACYSLLNPLLILFFVKTFREFAKGICLRIFQFFVQLFCKRTYKIMATGGNGVILAESTTTTPSKYYSQFAKIKQKIIFNRRTAGIEKDKQ